jgi:urea carboxylase
VTGICWIEYGPLVLDLNLRFRARADDLAPRASTAGIVDLTPGIRSLQVHFDDRVLPLRRLDGFACQS